MLAFFGFGMLIGSFLNVCIYRMPKGESLAFPASHCPQCQTALHFYDNIPVLSYLFLRGKCRFCKAPISEQYPLVELLTGLLFMLTVLRFGFSLSVPVYATLQAILIVAIFVDAAHMIIPDKITIPGIIIGFLASFLPRHPVSWQNSLLGILVAGGFLYLVAVLSVVILKKEGMGGGDIKLAAAIGAFLGWQRSFLAVMLGAFLGSVVGIALILIRRKGRKEYIPFGPFLACGAIISLYWGNELIDWYLSFFR
ncbi:MAG: prepilin peptidase [Candidatus Schekmanbacteria bacterium]|nr:prepilin peptidase [Candidatus Schekmanbacteria bacterium]